MADDQNLSTQDIKDLQDIASKLPTGHPMQKKVALLLSSQPTQFETDRPGSGSTGGFGGQFASAFIPSGVNPYPGMDLEAKSAIADASRQADEMRKKEGAGLPYRIGAALPFTNASAMEDAARHGDTSGVLGAAAAPMVQAASPLVPEALSRTKNAISHAAFSPEGEMKPGVRTASQIGGAAIGSAYGLSHGSPYGAAAGGAAGYRLGPSMIEAMFKPKAEPPAWEAPAHTDIYGSSDFPGPMSKLSARLPKSMRGDPFSPPIPTVEATPVPAELGSPENPGLFSKLPTRLPSNLRGDPFQPRVSPLDPTATPAEGTSRSNIDTNSQDLISRMKKIAVPGEEPSAADLKRAGDFTQVGTDRLKALAKFGDKLAKNELNRRLRQ